MTNSTTRARSRTPLVAAALVVAALLALGIVPRILRNRSLSTEANAASDSVATVSVAIATRGASGPVSLPGTLQPLHEATIYARAAGYVRAWYADLGAHVAQGQTLATIEAPEVDQEVRQAEAQLKQAEATLALARSDLDRWKALARDSAVSRQELDQKTAAYEASAATASAQRANLQRLTSVQGYSRIEAPFAGVITARNVDVGTLVNPGTNAAGTGLYKIAQSGTMRVYLNVPQSLAPAIKVGQNATIQVAERRGVNYTGQVARTSDALDPATRTLLVEVDVPNTDGSLLAGSFVQVQLASPNNLRPVTVPSNALLVNTQGTQVITIDASHVAHYHKVDVGRDYGTSVEILSGLDEGAMVALNPSDDIKDGRVVRTVAAPKS